MGKWASAREETERKTKTKRVGKVRGKQTKYGKRQIGKTKTGQLSQATHLKVRARQINTKVQGSQREDRRKVRKRGKKDKRRRKERERGESGRRRREKQGEEVEEEREQKIYQEPRLKLQETVQTI